jgi:6-phosphogluconolactonase/glucosamine-6-phosphate isomerase/deaminase
MMQHRVTLLPGVLERARHTLCLVTGADKAEALQNYSISSRQYGLQAAEFARRPVDSQ